MTRILLSKGSMTWLEQAAIGLGFVLVVYGLYMQVSQ